MQRCSEKDDIGLFGNLLRSEVIRNNWREGLDFVFSWATAFSAPVKKKHKLNETGEEIEIKE